MIINIASVLNGEKESISFCGEENFPAFEFNGEKHEFVEPIKVSGCVSSKGEIFELDLKITAKIAALCSRCTKPLVHTMVFETLETLSITEADEDVIYVSGTTLDLSDIVKESIYNNMPIRFLCDKNCKGLCPKCGIDKNVKDCTCDEENNNSVFSKLDELFKK